MNIFQSINKKRSNVHCDDNNCEHNYDGICTHDVRIDEYKDSAYVLICGCDIPEDELIDSIGADMYWL